ncbi:MAG: Thiol peroxidase, Tpx-type (EC [uncultured Thiotrichaceae bacterium]|uniref:Thiol peroxidase n=1 Tax=uncultured Thiotrichaceae bacterium TaxID=298394 RepID=A0A6S6U6N3_9GAMM|nr:MAG: Thiol peroxidase, Tpx-type (EC [uncultured Thiotrichaceae bacterium]
MATITLHDDEINTNGDLPEVGTTAPAATLTDGELNDVTLDSFAGKKKLLNIVPSLDTGICAISTKKFNDAAAAHEDTVFLTISADLPFAMGRFCEAENIDQVKTLSMMRDRNFAKDYGVLITDGPLAGITARAVVVMDADNNITYTELVPEIAQEPDYESAIAAL